MAVSRFFGGEAGDEVEVGFAGLYAVFAGLVLEADLAADVGQLLLGQHAGDDVGTVWPWKIRQLERRSKRFRVGSTMAV